MLDFRERYFPAEAYFRAVLRGFADVRRLDLVARAQDHGPLDHVAQFAHVSRPVVMLHLIQRRWRDAPGLLSRMRGKKLQLPGDQVLDVGGTLAQWRQRHGDDVEPVEQILA